MAGEAPRQVRASSSEESLAPWNVLTQTTQQPGREIGLMKGLSRMRGNSHVRFLEGLGARKSPRPTRRRRRIHVTKLYLL